MTIDQAEAIAEIMAGDYRVEIREHYYGRFRHYSTTTAALVVPADAVRFVSQAGVLSGMTDEEVAALRVDDHGPDRVIY